MTTSKNYNHQICGLNCCNTNITDPLAMSLELYTCFYASITNIT